MNKQEYIDEAEQYVLHTYNRFPVVLDHGDGVYLYDSDGKEYLDFAAGIAVYALGYNDKEFNDALKKQIDKIIHTSNLFYHTGLGDAAKKIVTVSGMDKVFFTNSGTEAIEGAIKAARKYAFNKDGCTDHEIIAMKHSFHGRSVGALSVTGNAHYQEAFKPLMGGVKFATYNNFDSVMNQVTDKTCAIIMETVQGEGGIYPADEDFLKDIRSLCDEKDILLILDEIQCGMGRTGTMFACEQYKVKPDIMTVAKALGCGIPVGAFLLNEKVATNSLVPGDHGTTYGGNPLACAAVSTVIDLYKEKKILDHVNEITPYFEQQLDDIVHDFGCVVERRGKGLMQGLVIAGRPVGEVVNKAIEEGLFVISAGSDVLRMVPPLVIEKQHVDEMVTKLRKALEE